MELISSLNSFDNLIEEIIGFHIFENTKFYQFEKFQKEIERVTINSLSAYNLSLDEDIVKKRILDVMRNKKWLRECGDTYVTNINTGEIKNKIVKIKGIEQPEQRTPAWYQFRHNHITASNAWKSFGTASKETSLYMRSVSL